MALEQDNPITYEPEIGWDRTSPQLYWSELFPPQGTYAHPFIQKINRRANAEADFLIAYKRHGYQLLQEAHRSELPSFFKAQSIIFAHLNLLAVRMSAEWFLPITESIAKVTGGRRTLGYSRNGLLYPQH